MAYHYAYYDRLVQAAGLSRGTGSSLSGYFRRDHYVPERFFQIATKFAQGAATGYKSFDSKREMHAWVPRAAEVSAANHLRAWLTIPLPPMPR